VAERLDSAPLPDGALSWTEIHFAQLTLPSAASARSPWRW
jgi:hypothetical protein